MCIFYRKIEKTNEVKLKVLYLSLTAVFFILLLIRIRLKEKMNSYESSFIITQVYSTGEKSINGKFYYFVAPILRNKPGKMNFTLYVPKSKHEVFLKLCFTQQNGLECSIACKDSILVIKINNQTMFNDVVFDWEGKICKYISLKNFKGKRIKVEILDYAGGVCSKWCGEGVLVSYPEILEYY